MAYIGLRKPYVAKYSCVGGTVSYTEGQLLAKAIEFSSSIEAGDDNNLYADDNIAESDASFGSGSVSIGTDDLMPDASALILGVTKNTVTVNEKQCTELVYDDDTVSPELGFGIIIPRKKGGVVSYRAVVLARIKFNIPEDSATTKGEKIEWNTPTISGSILRADDAKHTWKYEADCPDEATAEAYIKQKLNIT